MEVGVGGTGGGALGLLAVTPGFRQCVGGMVAQPHRIAQRSGNRSVEARFRRVRHDGGDLSPL